MYAIGYYPHVILLQPISICASASPINYSSPSSLSSCLSAHIHLSLCPYPRVPLISPCSYACSISSCPLPCLPLCLYLPVPLSLSTRPSAPIQLSLFSSHLSLCPYPTDLLLLITCLTACIHLSICPYSPEPLLYSPGHLLQPTSQLTLLSYISVLLTHLLSACPSVDIHLPLFSIHLSLCLHPPVPFPVSKRP
jgi:hypothetical protein